MGGVMDILSRAIAAYENEEYARSIDLFERAAQIYGADVVEYQMHLCRKALAAEQAEAGRSDEGDSQAIDVNLLDPATTYMLSRMGKLRLSEAEERQCLERYVTNTRDVSADADAKPVKPIPDGWPAYVVLAPLPQVRNTRSESIWMQADTQHVDRRAGILDPHQRNPANLHRRSAAGRPDRRAACGAEPPGHPRHRVYRCRSCLLRG